MSGVDVTANTAYTISAEMTRPGSGAVSATDTPAPVDTVPAKSPSHRPKKTKAKTKAKAKTKIDKTKVYESSRYSRKCTLTA